jgi:hypothetical protein
VLNGARNTCRGQIPLRPKENHHRSRPCIVEACCSSWANCLRPIREAAILAPANRILSSTEPDEPVIQRSCEPWVGPYSNRSAPGRKPSARDRLSRPSTTGRSRHRRDPHGGFMPQHPIGSRKRHLAASVSYTIAPRTSHCIGTLAEHLFRAIPGSPRTSPEPVQLIGDLRNRPPAKVKYLTVHPSTSTLLV